MAPDAEAPQPSPSAPERPQDPSQPAPDATPGGRDGDLPPGLPASDAELPVLTLTEIARLDAPIDTAVLADGTVVVAQRGGVVRVILGPDGTADGPDGAGRVVVDVSDRTTTESERGLLSIAVPPDGRMLVLSFTDLSGDTLIEAYPLVDGRVAGPARTLYALAQPFANHNGGSILFTSDGLLLVGLGDGGGRGDPLGAGQDRSTPLGSVLRLDVSGPDTLPAPDNPFIGDASAAPEIAAIGLRNPWRMSLDAPRDELWIADVGQSTREEINRVALEDLPGANFGWPLREGDVAFDGEEPDGHVPPVHAYAHGPGCSVTGGHVYRGTALPGLVGAYVFSDWCDGRIRVLADEDGTVVARPLDVSGERVVGFGRDARGELLVLELSGRVLRLEPA